MSEKTKPGLILDKCFLQAISQRDMTKLSEQYQLVVSGPLFYELITSSDRKRINCFSKFPARTNPVLLVDHVGTLIRKELVHCRPSGKPSANRINIDFEFNPQLLQPGYEFPIKAARELEHQSLELSSEIYQIIEISKTSESLFGALLAGTQQEQDQARITAEAKIANLDAVRNFYGTLEAQNQELPYPPKEIVDSNWTVLRWLQAKMLFSLDIHIRYRGKVDEMLSPKVLEKLEHDLHDMQHLTLAMLEGAFATNEKKLQRWWKLLMPTGDLLSTNGPIS